ncbi:MAG: BamA/TamA family outer membrane protein [Acidobacteriota bacterium]
MTLALRFLAACCACCLATSLFAQERPASATSGPILNELVLDGSTVFNRDDVLWLLALQTGAPLPGQPSDIANQLRRRYEREGYTDVEVVPIFDPDSGRLTLAVRETRIDEIEVTGVPEEVARSFKADLAARDLREGVVYNLRLARTAVDRVVQAGEGAIRVGRLAGTGPDHVELVTRGDRHVLIVPLRRERGRFSFTTGSGATQDLFNPVDGFAPVVGFEAVAFDRTGFNHTFVGGSVSYRFAPATVGYSVGIERPLLNRPRLFAGAEAHDLAATDDLWRLSTSEQSLVSLVFKNTFRDYYERRGLQVYAGIRPGPRQELVVSLRRDRHEPLANETNFSVFRDHQSFRPNAAIGAGDLDAVVLAYTFDSRGLDGGAAARFERHLIGDLFRGTRRQAFGWRIDWTSELAGHGTGGDDTFERHILNARTYVPVLPRQSIAARVIAGLSSGLLPAERQFAIGGIGTVHGYGFKEAAGARMLLLNAEYRLDLLRSRLTADTGPLGLLLFFDAGRVDRPFPLSTSDWLRGVGAGVHAGPIRVEFGYRLNAIPRSRQILLRLSPTF